MEAARRELWLRVKQCQQWRLLTIAVGTSTLEALLLAEETGRLTVNGLVAANARLWEANAGLTAEVERLRFLLNLTADRGQVAMCHKHLLARDVEKLADELKRIAAELPRQSNRLAMPVPEFERRPA